MSVLLTYTLIFLPQNKDKGFSLRVLALLRLVSVFFLAPGYLILYLAFELSLVPTLYILIRWGYQPERLNASLYFVLYTLVGSLPLLLLFLKGARESFSLLFPCLPRTFVWFLRGMVSFLIKIPIWGVHLWLPKAHVEAPVGGSMVLAGILLKLGGFGILKLWGSFLAIPKGSNLLVSILFWRGFILPLFSLILVDAKVLIAYFSIIHIAIITLGLLRGSNVGYWGAGLLMLAHGFSSPLMFFLVNKYYSISLTRNILFQKGIRNVTPVLGGIWFITLLHGMGTPPSLRIAAEILVCFSLVKISLISLMLIGVSVFLGGAIRLYLFSRFLGPRSSLISKELTRRELKVVHLLLLPLSFWLGFSY